MKNNTKSIKGAKVRQLGYQTSIHALPTDIREKIDLLFDNGLSVPDVMKRLEKRYPEIHIPSRTAFYNYKKKYANKSTSDGVVDIKDLPVKSVLLEHLKRFVAFDLPTLRDNYYKSIKDSKLGSQKQTARLYLDGIKLALEMTNRLNINYSDCELDNERRTDDFEAEFNKKTTEEQMRSIVSKYGKELIIASKNQATLN